MSGIRVTPEQLAGLSSRVSSGSASIEGELRSLVDHPRAAGQRLGRRRPAALPAAVERVAEVGEGLHDALTGISQLLSQAGTSYAEAERQIASSFGSCAPRRFSDLSEVNRPLDPQASFRSRQLRASVAALLRRAHLVQAHGSHRGEWAQQPTELRAELDDELVRGAEHFGEAGELLAPPNRRARRSAARCSTPSSRELPPVSRAVWPSAAVSENCGAISTFSCSMLPTGWPLPQLTTNSARPMWPGLTSWSSN